MKLLSVIVLALWSHVYFVAGQECSDLETEDCCIEEGCAYCYVEVSPEKGSGSKGRRRTTKQVRGMVSGSDDFMSGNPSPTSTASSTVGHQKQRRRLPKDNILGKGKGGVCSASLTCIDVADVADCDDLGGEIIRCAEEEEECPTSAPTSSPTNEPWVRRQLFGGNHDDTSVNGLILPNAEEAMEIITEHNADPNANFVFQEQVLAKDKCQILVDYVDAAMTDAEKQKLHKVDMTMDDLVRLIGVDSTLDVVTFFEQERGLEETINRMYISRAPGSNEERDFYVPWHKDEYATMELELNDFFVGGELLHLTRDGVVKKHMDTGSAYIHGTDIIHGVPPVRDGPRYSLIMKHHFNDFETVISKEMIMKKWHPTAEKY